MDVAFVGVNTPASAIIGAVEAERPDAVGLSVTMLGGLPRTLAVARQLRERDPNLLVVVGGRAVRGSHALAAETDVAIDSVGDLAPFRAWASQRAS